MKVYLDTSVMLAWLLEGRAELASISKGAPVASSRLLWIESSRSLDRAVRGGQLSDGDGTQARIAFEKTARGIIRLRLTETILSRAAEGFPTIIRTLDALHLATAEAWQASGEEEVELWTFDRQMNLCAAAMGFRTPFL